MIDKLASRYGWTIEQIYDLTFSQVDSLSRAIAYGELQETKTKVELQGHKWKGPTGEEYFSNAPLDNKLSEEANEVAKKQLEEMQSAVKG